MAISTHARSNAKLVGYHGVMGAHSHDAVEELVSNQPSFRNRSFEPKGFSSIDDLFDALRSRAVDYAIVPIENAHSGTLNSNLNPIIESARTEGGIAIAGEYVHEEKNALLVKDSSIQLSDITDIRSHSAIFDQTRQWLREAKRRGDIRQDVRLIAFQNSAEAAKQLSLDKMNNSIEKIAVIASENCRKFYGLHALVDNVSPTSNFTRYYLLSSEFQSDSETAQRHLNPKTTMVLTLSNRSGVLFKVLGCFSLRDINVSHLSFHPTPRAIGLSTPWEYRVWLDVDGAPQSDLRVRNAIENLKEFVQETVILGTYPRYLAPLGGSVNGGNFSM